MKDRARQVIIAILGFTLLYVLGKSVEYEVKAAQTDCVFCCSSNCDGANGGVVPTASPTPTPTPTPSPTPTPPPEGTATVDMVCSTYGIANRDVASGGDLTVADTIRDTCKLVLTWWRQTTAQNWCPYIMDGTAEKAEYCGPYNNFGYMNGGSASDTSNLGAMQYFFGGYSASCTADNGNGANRDCGLVLRNTSSAVPVYNAWGNNAEKLMDKGSYGDSSKFIDKWFADFIDVPDSPSQLAAWTSTAASNNWNMVFVDNFQIWVQPDGGLGGIPIDPRRGGSYTQSNIETDALAGASHLRSLADAAGKKLFCNMDGDADYHYFERGTTYRTWVSKCHFVLLEQQGVDFGGNYVTEAHWLRRMNIFQDIATAGDVNALRAARVVEDLFHSAAHAIPRTKDFGGIPAGRAVFDDSRRGETGHDRIGNGLVIVRKSQAPVGGPFNQRTIDRRGDRGCVQSVYRMSRGSNFSNRVCSNLVTPRP